MSAVADFERAFADYVGARYAIAICNGTATLHTALVALGVKPGDKVAVPPLTMSATTIAVLHAGATPVFVDVDPDAWLMTEPGAPFNGSAVPVSLYGLHHPGFENVLDVDDAAQTLRPRGKFGFTSYSFQASKILALGEGGMLVTNDETLAIRARSFSSLGYPMQADQPGISKRELKDPAYARHYSLGWNYRMADKVAERGLALLSKCDDWSAADGRYVTIPWVDILKRDRQKCAGWYRDVVAGCSWIRPQQVPRSGTHDYWAYAVALESADLWHPFADAIERHGGTRPFAAWRLTYDEPAFQHLVGDMVTHALPGSDDYVSVCPVAEDLQPRIVAGQTNCQASATRNAAAWAAAIKEMNG